MANHDFTIAFLAFLKDHFALTWIS